MEAVIHDVLLHYFEWRMVYVCAITQNTLVVSFRWVHHVNGPDMLDSGILDMSQNLCLLSDLHQKLNPFFLLPRAPAFAFLLMWLQRRRSHTPKSHKLRPCDYENGRGDHAYNIMKTGLATPPTQL